MKEYVTREHSKDVCTPNLKIYLELRYGTVIFYIKDSDKGEQTTPYTTLYVLMIERKFLGKFHM